MPIKVTSACEVHAFHHNKCPPDGIIAEIRDAHRRRVAVYRMRRRWLRLLHDIQIVEEFEVRLLLFNLSESPKRKSIKCLAAASKTAHSAENAQSKGAQLTRSRF